MKNVLMRGSLQSLWVKFNGDRDDNRRFKKKSVKIEKRKEKIAKKEAKLSESTDQEKFELYKDIADLERSNEKDESKLKDSTILVSFEYPRSGESSVEAIRKIKLNNGKDNVLEMSDEKFLESALFKEVIQGETTLKVSITDTDSSGSIAKFLRSVASSVFGGIAGDAAKGIGDVVLNKTAGNLSEKMSDAIADDDDDIKIVAISEKITIQINTSGEVEVTGKNCSFEDGILELKLKTPKLLKIADTRDTQSYLPKGSGNGIIRIRLKTESI